MGTFLEFKCTDCGYEITCTFGIGMLFPLVYEETINSARKGELGEEIKKFFQNNPNGAIDIKKVLSMCLNCGEYEMVKDLTMYVPKKNTLAQKKKRKGRWSVAMPFYEKNYVTSWDLKDDYEYFAKYPHKCKNCGGEVKIFNEDEVINVEHLKCPKCHSTMIESGFGSWD